jgi:hypothetical protein
VALGGGAASCPVRTLAAWYSQLAYAAG